MKVRPLHDRIIVQRIEEGEQKIGGIIIPDTAKEKPMQGKVVAVGPGARDENGKHLSGKVGAEVSVEEAYRRARIIGLQLLSATRMALGSLDRVDTVVKMLCMVNAVPDFRDHPKVANGMSDLFVEVFGENGKHARSAVGMGSLPTQISVEIEGTAATSLGDTERTLLRRIHTLSTQLNARSRFQCGWLAARHFSALD